MSKVTRQGAGRQSISTNKEWSTPDKYVRAVKEVFAGTITFDPCSNKFSTVSAKVECVLPQDGLEHSWDYSTIYVNPPYGVDKTRGSRIKDWIAKCAHANAAYGSEVLALIPVATNTLHWKQYIFPKARSICFLADTRLKFLENGKVGGKGAPMACAMIYWGEDLKSFKEVFSKLGTVISL